MAARLTDEAQDAIFREARTFNHFTDEPVTAADAEAVWELMKWGPTSANQLPARLVWCLGAESRDRLARFASDTNAAKIRAAPAAVIVAMDLEFYEELPTLFPHADARSWFLGNPALIRESAFRNSTLQGAYLIVAARALGLDVGPMSGFDGPKLDEEFFAGTTWKANFIATIGHGDRGTLHARLPRPAFQAFNRVL